ncbi:hypothetical protein KEJ27_04190 [Candidatus Bathyarchaeota archaeon]|nr:hypothetical protein [Candidatus Bathyarchaeota archaeon]MBS7613201.1 hypothetical protein [Candidatus Bathyarchaeota archaeon]MBS7617125.1 hypothetical protein [Candidatus Bathyarchaeota archaeon]
MPLPDAEDIAEFIALRYGYAFKIVEIGVGFQFDVAVALKKKLPNTLIVVVDVNPDAVEEARKLSLTAYVDDILTPNMEIYEGSSLLYSIRPPPELIPYIRKTAEKLKCPLIIRLLSGELINLQQQGWRTIIYGKARLQLLDLGSPR